MLIIVIVTGAGLYCIPRTVHSLRKPVPLAAIVNGLPVSMAAYQRQLRFARNSYSGPGAPGQTPTGRTITQLLENQAINQAIAELLIDHTAAQYHVEASSADVHAELARMAQVAGGTAALQRQARTAGMK